MIFRKSAGLVGWSSGALVLGLLAACAAPAPEPSHGTASAVTQEAFDRNSVIDDKSMNDADTLGAADLQAILDKTPWNTTSALAAYTENGKTAAQIMADTAKAHGINPLEMIVRVQMEQGLISKTTASDATIGVAFGCGCPDGSTCADKYKGFTTQAECAAGIMRRAMDASLTSTGTVSGWARNRSKQSLDGLTIIPKTAATAALYTYTPWVGESGGGRAGVGGVSLHAQVWNRFAEAASYGEWAAPTATNAPSTDADAGPTAPPPPPAADSGVDPNQDPSDPSNPGDPTPDVDAGAPGADAASPSAADAGPRATPSTSGPPEDGSDDSTIVGEGSTPPESNAPPPRIPTTPEELPTASEADLAGKSKSSQGGCSTTGSAGFGSAWMVGLAVALVAARRRRA